MKRQGYGFNFSDFLQNSVSAFFEGFHFLRTKNELLHSVFYREILSNLARTVNEPNYRERERERERENRSEYFLKINSDVKVV